MKNPVLNPAANPALLRFGALAALKFFPRLRFGNTVVFSRWTDVQEVLRRDLDFLIGPINGEKIGRVNGPFVLGMDRGATHLHERRILYGALRQTDPARIGALAGREADRLLAEIPPGGTIDAVNGYARPVAAHSSTALMGVGAPEISDFMRVIRALFHECFLNLGDDPSIRDRAVQASLELRSWCEQEIARRKALDGTGEDMLGRLLATGELDEDAIRRTLSGMMVGSVDTTATCVAQIMSVILSRPGMLRAVREDLGDPLRMRGWCWEALRFWPHNPIVQRQAAADTTVGGTPVKAGARVICFTLAAMHDPGIFSHPEQADPRRPEHTYLHFGGGLHPCAGWAVNGVQIPLLVARLLRREPVIGGQMEFDGPFPDRLPLTLGK